MTKGGIHSPTCDSADKTLGKAIPNGLHKLRSVKSRRVQSNIVSVEESRRTAQLS